MLDRPEPEDWRHHPNIELLRVRESRARDLNADIARNASLGRVVVVGCGFRGATAAKYLRLLSDGRIEVILVDQRPAFISCLVSNRVLGGLRTLEQLTLGYDMLESHHGVKRMA